MRLIFVRHPATTALRDKIIYGQSEADLTPEGVATIETVADRLAKEDPAIIYCTPYSRTRILAGAIASRHPGVALTEEPRISELHCGIYEQMTFEEALERGGEDARRFIYEFASYRPKGGENFEDVTQRTAGFLKELEGHPELKERPAILVCHAIAIRSMLATLLGQTMEQLWRIDIEPSCILEVNYDPEYKFGRLMRLENPDRL